MTQFWQERTIGMFKDDFCAWSDPQDLLSFLGKQTYFSLLDQANSDLYHLIKDNNTGGLSIIFHRYLEVGKNGQAAKPCEKFVGYDANSFYLWAIMRDMPTGGYTRSLGDSEFKPESSIKMAIEWLEWRAYKERIHIRYQFKNTEKRIGVRKLPVDGFDAETRTVYQFQGCFWHGRDCALNRGKEYNDKRQKLMVEVREETITNTKYIRSKGYRVVEM